MPKVMSYGGENLRYSKSNGHSKGSKITENNYIDPRILKLEHDKLLMHRNNKIFLI